MTLYNVDFFDRSMNYVHHDTVDSPEIDMDYLSPDSSSFVVQQTNNIPAKGLIYFEEIPDFLGVVETVEQGTGETTVTFKPFITVFDQAVLFRTNTQKSSQSLEDTIGQLINAYWGTGTGDSEQSMPIEVVTDTQTNNWTLNISPDVSGKTYCICNFYSAILIQALTKYRVAINAKANPNLKKITITISVSPNVKVIEANMSGVNVDAFTVGQLNSDVNKLEIWNENSYSTGSTGLRYYYLHTDGTYDNDGTKNRIKPVKLEVISVSASTSGNAFKNAADEQADQRFGDLQWTNYIELSVLKENKTIDPESLEIGQKTCIFYNKKYYDTILTGKKIGDMITLMFGKLRLDLSKKDKLKTTLEYIDAKTITKNSKTAKK